MSQTPTRLDTSRDGEYVVSSFSSSTSGVVPDMANETRPGRKLLSRFGMVMLPIATAAAFSVPGYEGRVRTTFSRASRSQSFLLDIAWSEDVWKYYEEPADLEQVRMLNRLLALPASDGFSLDLAE
jgi:hypothetical protein